MMRQRGFTLIELMFTLAVGVILIAVGVPSFRGVIMDNRMSTEANQFVTSVNLARSAAVRYQRNASVCTSANFDAAVPTCTASADWSNGWIVFVDKDRDGATDANEIVSVSPPLNNASSFSSTAANGVFAYDPRGFGLVPGANLTMCDTRSGEMGRFIRVNATGRTNVARQVCP